MTPSVTPALANVAGFLLNQVAQRIREETDGALAGLGIRPRQVGILLVVKADGPQSQQTLGAVLNMDRTTTMQLVDALEHRGVVERLPDPGDRRAHRVALTSEGRRLLRAVERQVAAVENDVLGGLSEAERRDLNRLLRAALERGPRGGSIPSSRAPRTGRKRAARRRE